MKTFRYAKGHIAGVTMTVGELRKHLEQYPEDLPVMAQWEGCNAYINSNDFSIESVSKGNPDDECDCLVIDVNSY